VIGRQHNHLIHQHHHHHHYQQQQQQQQREKRQFAFIGNVCKFDG